MFGNRKDDASKAVWEKHIRTLNWINLQMAEKGFFLDLTYAVKEKWNRARILTIQDINQSILTLHSNLISNSIRKFSRTLCLKSWQCISKQTKQRKTSLWCLEPNTEKIMLDRVKIRQKPYIPHSPTHLYPSNNNNWNEHIMKGKKLSPFHF